MIVDFFFWSFFNGVSLLLTKFNSFSTFYKDFFIFFLQLYLFLSGMKDNVTHLKASLNLWESSFLVTVLIHLNDTNCCLGFHLFMFVITMLVDNLFPYTSVLHCLDILMLIIPLL